MLEINGTNIALTRGNSAYISVPVLNADGTPYEPQSGDRVALQVRTTPVTGIGATPPVVINGSIDFDQDGVPLWYISPTDSTIPAMTYSWDAELTFANGDVCTYTTGLLTIMPENTTNGGEE